MTCRGVSLDRGQKLMRLYLIVMPMIRNDIHGLNNVRMLQRRADTELCCHFLLVFLFAFTRPFGPELLDSEDVAAILMAGFDQSYCTTSPGTKDTAPFSIFLSKVCLRRLGKRYYGVGAIDM